VLDRGLGRPEQSSTVDLTVGTKPKTVFPAWEDADPVEVSRMYQEMIKAGREGREVEFLPRREQGQTSPGALSAAKAPPLAAPKPLKLVPVPSEDAVPVPRRPQEATGAGRIPESPPVGPSEPEIGQPSPRRSAAPAPRELAKETWETPDWQDRTLVSIVEAPAAVVTLEPERDKHVCKPHPDAVRSCCRALWVRS
jgi:hypothetical protein